MNLCGEFEDDVSRTPALIQKMASIVRLQPTPDSRSSGFFFFASIRFVR